MSDDLVTLWRPTGPRELALVEATGSRRWPPRLPDQPLEYWIPAEELDELNDNIVGTIDVVHTFR